MRHFYNALKINDLEDGNAPIGWSHERRRYDPRDSNGVGEREKQEMLMIAYSLKGEILHL